MILKFCVSLILKFSETDQGVFSTGEEIQPDEHKTSEKSDVCIEEAYKTDGSTEENCEEQTAQVSIS